MAEEGAPGVGDGQAEDGEIDFELFCLAELQHLIDGVVRGDVEITTFTWKQDIASREVEGGSIERFSSENYHIRVSYRRKR